MKSGFVSLIGRPNVGKSTLINAIVGKKISIISPKSQTTRDAIQGIYNDDDSQIVFVDTPGIHKPKTVLDKEMDKIAFYNARTNDLTVLLIDASIKFSDGDNYILRSLNKEVPLIVAFNKIDESNVILINELKEKYKELLPDSPIIEMSALEEFNIDELIKTIKTYLVEGPQYYDVKTITNKDFKFYVEETIREVALKLLKEEVPHSIAVICDEHFEGKNIFAKIIVEKDSQKGIIIGKRGQMIKKIGIRARKQIEEYLGYTINLELVVQVEKDWKNSNKFLSKIGYK